MIWADDDDDEYPSMIFNVLPEDFESINPTVAVHLRVFEAMCMFYVVPPPPHTHTPYPHTPHTLF